MIDLKATKENLELLRFVKLQTDEQNNALSNVLVVVEQFLEAKVPEKKDYVDETDENIGRGAYYQNKYYEGFNDCHDQFTALIARDYVSRDKLLTEEELFNILHNTRISMQEDGQPFMLKNSAEVLAADIRERIEKGTK